MPRTFVPQKKDGYISPQSHPRQSPPLNQRTGKGVRHSKRRNQTQPKKEAVSAMIALQTQWNSTTGAALAVAAAVATAAAAAATDPVAVAATTVANPATVLTSAVDSPLIHRNRIQKTLHDKHAKGIRIPCWYVCTLEAEQPRKPRLRPNKKPTRRSTRPKKQRTGFALVGK